MAWWSNLARASSIYNAGRRVYSSLPSWSDTQEFVGGPVHDAIFGSDYGPDGSVPVGSSQAAADAAYVRRAAGYRLNPNRPLLGSSSRSSVGHVLIWS